MPNTITLKNVTLDGDASDVLVVHDDQTSARLPSGSLLAAGDAVVAEQSGNFEIDFNDGAATSTVAVEGATPANVSIPDPSFFDAIEDYYDGGSGVMVHTLQIGDDAISIRG